jgi:hypothetical protein
MPTLQSDNEPKPSYSKAGSWKSINSTVGAFAQPGKADKSTLLSPFLSSLMLFIVTTRCSRVSGDLGRRDKRMRERCLREADKKGTLCTIFYDSGKADAGRTLAVALLCPIAPLHASRSQ